MLGWVDEVGDSGTTADNINAALTQAHAQRCSQDKWTFMLWRKPETLTLISGQRDYTLHPEFNRPLYFRNTTDREFLEEFPLRTLTDPDVDWNNDTEGRGFVLHGVMPVSAQPTSASVLTLVSSDATDTGSAKNITIRGETAYGVESETLTPLGLTPVVGAKAFITILNVTLTLPFAGRLSLTSNSGGVTNLLLTPGQYGRQHQQMRLLWTPGSGDTIEYQFFRKPSPLSNDYDIPDIPAPFAKILVWDALLLMAAYDNQVEGNRLALWKEKQMALDTALRQAYLDGQSIKSRGRYVKYSGD